MKPSKEIRWGALVAIAWFVGIASVALVTFIARLAHGAVPDADVLVCKAACETIDVVQVKRDLLVQWLREKAALQARVDEVERQAEEAIAQRDAERAKPRCSS